MTSMTGSGLLGRVRRYRLADHALKGLSGHRSSLALGPHPGPPAAHLLGVGTPAGLLSIGA